MARPSTVENGVPLVAQVTGRRLSIALNVSTTFFFWMAQYVYAPTLPNYVQSKTDNLATVGMILSMYGLWQAIVRLPVGIAADWLGWRKPFIVVGLMLSGLGAWVLGTADGPNALLVGRSITGLAAATWVPLVVAFSALFPPQQAVYASALLTMSNTTGRILATSVTGSLNDWGGYQTAFFIAAAIAVLSVLTILPVQEERRPSKRPSLADTGRLIVRKDVLLPSLLNAIAQYANWAVTFGFLPVLVKQMGGSDVTQSIVTASGLVAYTIGSFVASRLTARIGSRIMAYVSLFVMCLGIALAACAPSLPVLFVAQLVLGFAMGIAYPLFMGLSIRYVSDSERTTAMGLHQAVYAIGMFAGPAVSGNLAAQIGIQPMFGVTAAGCLALGVLGTGLLKDKNRGERAS
jgi:MFS family permease